MLQLINVLIYLTKKIDFFPFLFLSEANDTNFFVSRIHELTNIMRSKFCILSFLNSLNI